MVRGVLSNAKYITSQPLQNTSLQLREGVVRKKIDIYRKTAAAGGGIAGAGGKLLLGLADFPGL
jgi:hypothetical protein